MNPAERKDALLGEILKLTESVTFVGDENDPQRYIDLMERRTPLFEEIYGLDEKIEGERVTAPMREKLLRIKKLDEENAAYAQKADGFLKSRLREASNTRHLNSAYNQMMPSAAGASFDSKN
ncbi:MAG: hypothetical protein LBU36_00330 [Clostridiales bacterium]|jgi:hypothetical protein|nr:hypothetical protein [Clostridiales bacterium]